MAAEGVWCSPTKQEEYDGILPNYWGKYECNTGIVPPPGVWKVTYQEMLFSSVTKKQT